MAADYGRCGGAMPLAVDRDDRHQREHGADADEHRREHREADADEGRGGRDAAAPQPPEDDEQDDGDADRADGAQWLAQEDLDLEPGEF